MNSSNDTHKWLYSLFSHKHVSGVARALLTSGEQVGEVGLGEAEARVPVTVVAREQVLLPREPPLVIQAVVLLQES